MFHVSWGSSRNNVMSYLGVHQRWTAFALGVIKSISGKVLGSPLPSPTENSAAALSSGVIKRQCNERQG